MASSYSTSLKIQLINNGEQSNTWGSSTNTNWNLIEQAVAGAVSIPMSNANYTMTNLNGVSDEARNMILIVSGTNNAIYQVIAPLVPKFFIVTNNTSGGYAITIGASSGSLVTIPNGVTAQVYCDGSTGFYSAQTGSAGNFTVNGTLTATGLTDTGNMSVGGNLSVTGTTTLTGTSSLAATSFSVSPTAPTPTTGDNSTKIATTAFVQASTGSLGTMASQNANNVNITGGTITNATVTNATVNGNAVGSNSVGARTVSSSAPSGGSNGDIWYKV